MSRASEESPGGSGGAQRLVMQRWRRAWGAQGASAWQLWVCGGFAGSAASLSSWLSC